MAAVRVAMSNMGKTITDPYLDILDQIFKRQDVHYKALTDMCMHLYVNMHLNSTLERLQKMSHMLRNWPTFRHLRPKSQNDLMYFIWLCQVLFMHEYVNVHLPSTKESLYLTYGENGNRLTFRYLWQKWQNIRIRY